MQNTSPLQYRVPLIRLLEGGGGSVRGGGRKGGTVGEPVFAEPRFKVIADALGQVPIASAALGAVAGFPAGRLVASHFAVMTRHTAQVLIGGPALVERALGVKRTKEELGGVEVHAKSGVIDNIAEDEQDAFDQMRRFLSYLPSNVWERAPRCRSDDDPLAARGRTAVDRAARLKRAVRHAPNHRAGDGSRLVLRDRRNLRS